MQPTKEQEMENKTDQTQTSRMESVSSSVAKPAVSQENGIIYGDFESEDLEEKILQLIQCSYQKPLMTKMQRLFLFIVHFGSEVLKVNRKGNVILHGQAIDKKSNILDFLEAAVSDQFSEKPVGYRAFLHALHEIN
ncbi:MAG: hypothetical protein AB2693_17380, partial [Candidatus Thiodiazotropha sp.]